MKDTASSTRTAERFVHLGSWVGLLITLGTAVGATAMAAGWTDSLSQGAAMLIVIVVMGLFFGSIPLNGTLLVASVVVGRRAGARSMRWVYGYLCLAAAVYGAAVVAVVYG